MRIAALLLATLTLFGADLDKAEKKIEARLRDVAKLQGVRGNQLLGYGLVVGLTGTGDKDQTMFTAQSLTNLLSRQGLTANPLLVKVKNVAAVMVTAELPPFARSGSRMDITVSSTGDAKSLAGGILLMTALQGPDGQTYAVAQQGREFSTDDRADSARAGIVNERLARRLWPGGNPIGERIVAPDFSGPARAPIAIDRKS